MRSVIISIGDELLIGQVLNTNAAFIAEQLNSVGIEVSRVVTVGDEKAEIVRCFEEQYNHADVIIITGGLGPTHDDVTRSAICEFFRVDCIPNDEARTIVERFLRQRNSPWTSAAEDQTLVPRGARVISNRFGTAPGELFERDGKHVIVMPGVPYEMEAMMTDFVVPFFCGKQTGSFILHRTLKTTGIAESVLATRLGNIEEIIQGEKLAFLPSPQGVRLRITVAGSDGTTCKQKLNAIESRIRAKAEKFIYGIDDEELEEVVSRILTERKLSIAVAESCTGGMIAHSLTNVPGSSNYFERGVVTYSDRSKSDILKVPEHLIQTHGAVSEETAKAMASGIKQISQTDIGISTTGIAGPSGGTPEKPVGLVWIGYSDSRETIAIKFNFGEGRLRVKQRTTQAALDLVRRKLLGLD